MALWSAVFASGGNVGVSTRAPESTGQEGMAFTAEDDIKG